MTNWCWAAVGLGIAAAYGTAGNKKQCDIATRVLAIQCCPDVEACNEAWPLRCALPPHYVNTFDKDGHQEFKFVKKHIAAGHPIGVRINRPGGHFVVIVGYLEANGKQELYIADPEDGDVKPCDFNKFLSSYRDDGSWQISYETGGGTIRKLTKGELRAIQLA